MEQRNRPFLMIVCRILRILVTNGSECSWWRLGSGSNLNPRVFKRYIEMMEGLKLVDVVIISSLHRNIKITKKGFDLIGNIDNVLKDIGLGTNHDLDIFR
jgi:predicted transcriptional regulator